MKKEYASVQEDMVQRSQFQTMFIFFSHKIRHIKSSKNRKVNSEPKITKKFSIRGSWFESGCAFRVSSIMMSM